MSFNVPTLIPWRQLTRTGLFSHPSEFRAIRRPLELTSLGKRFEPGEVLTDDAILNPRIRLRQLYEQRKIEPVEVPPGIGLVGRAIDRMRAEAARSTQVSDLPIPVFGSTHPFSSPVALAEASDQYIQPDPELKAKVKLKVKPNFSRSKIGPPSV